MGMSVNALLTDQLMRARQDDKDRIHVADSIQRDDAGSSRVPGRFLSFAIATFVSVTHVTGAHQVEQTMIASRMFE